MFEKVNKTTNTRNHSKIETLTRLRIKYSATNQIDRRGQIRGNDVFFQMNLLNMKKVSACMENIVQNDEEHSSLATFFLSVHFSELMHRDKLVFK